MKKQTTYSLYYIFLTKLIARYILFVCVVPDGTW